MLMFRSAEVFVLIVATIWFIELTRCYFEKRRKTTRKRPRKG